MRKNGASITDGDCFETLNLLHLSSCKMFTFCVVLHGAKQNMQINVHSRGRSTDWKSSLRRINWFKSAGWPSFLQVSL